MERTAKLDQMFRDFCEKVRDLSSGEFDFEEPDNERTFRGVIAHAMVNLKFTPRSLVQLTEWVGHSVTLLD